MSKKGRDTKLKIVKAAWELFYKQGYDDTTIEEIVDESGTSKGSFYHYFESKDALLGSLAYLFDEKYEELEKTLDFDAPIFDTLIFLNQELFDMIDNKIDRDLISKLYSTQLVRRGERSLLDNDRLYYKLLKRLMATGQERGELTTDISASDMVRLYAMCERALICDWCLFNFNFSLRSYSKEMLPMMICKIKK